MPKGWTSPGRGRASKRSVATCAVLRMPPGDIDAERPLTSLGLDSLTARAEVGDRARPGRDAPADRGASGIEPRPARSGGGATAVRASRGRGDFRAGARAGARQDLLSHGQQMLWVPATCTPDAPAPTTSGARGGSGASRRDGLAAGRRSDDRTSRVAGHGFPIVEERPQVRVVDRPAGTAGGGSGCSWRPWRTAMIVD